MPVIPALGKQSQENVSSSQPGLQSKTLSQKQMGQQGGPGSTNTCHQA